MEAPALDRATPWMHLVQASPDGILAFDRDFRYTAWNPAMERISGVPAERVLGRVAWEVFPFLREEGEDAYFAAALAGESRSTGDRPFRVPESGHGGYFRAEYAPLRDEGGGVVGGMAVVRETTHARSADEALQMQARVLDSMSEGVSVTDEAGYILYTNPAEDRMFGYAPGELVGRHVTVQNDYPPEENRRIVGTVIEALRQDGMWAGEWRNRRKDGTSFTTYARITALDLPGRRCWVCVQEDVTEWRSAQAERERLIGELERQAADLEARTREAEQLKDLTAALSEAAGVREVGEVMMRHGVAALGADAGVLALALPEGEEIEIVASIGYPEAACMGPGRRWPLRANLPIAEATRSREAVLVESPEAWAERYGAYTRGGSRSAAWAALPVHREGGVSGALLWTYYAPRPFDAGETALMLAVARICSQALERARLYDAARRARAEAEAANRAKTEFLSAMSHELRTPLNAIAGYVDLLTLGIHGPVSEAQAGALERIRRAQEVLLSLINDVLNYAKVEAGHLELRLSPVPLAEALAGTEALVGPSVRGKGLDYRVGPCDAALRVLGDPDRVQQILLNLLTNAVKFTDPGGRIELSAEPRDGAAVVRVADTGRGIPADKLGTIFDPFVQVDRHRTEASQQGVGLGLAISRDLARAMGGDITAASEVGVGSVFTLTLPLAAEPPAA